MPGRSARLDARSDALVRLDRRCVHLKYSGGYRRPVIGRDHVGRASRKLRPYHRLVEQVREGRGERAGVSRGKQGACDTAGAVVKHPAERVEVAGDNGGTGGHRLGKDHAEGLAAHVGSDVDVDAAQHPRLVLLGKLAQEHDPRAQRIGHIVEQVFGLPRPGHQQPQAGPLAGEPDERLAQHRKPLARLGEPAKEADRTTLTRPAGQRSRAGVAVDRHAVGYLPCPAAEMRPVILSRTICSSPCATDMARDRLIAVWKVATTGQPADSTASMDRLGFIGSCTWSTSNRPAVSQRRTRAAEIGPNASRATEPLYGTGTARPAGTTNGGRCSSSSAGASTLTW